MLKQKCTQRKAETEEMGKAKYEKTEKKNSERKRMKRILYSNRIILTLKCNRVDC